MFAMTSGTTGTPKRLPITQELFEEYKSGWKIWGAGVYGDHLDLMNKQTLQLSSDWQQFHAPSGVPCGQISGLAATTRPWVTRRVFLLPGTVSQIHDSAAKHYTSLRFALARTRHRHHHYRESEHADRIRPPSRSRQRIFDPRYPRRHALVRRAGACSPDAGAIDLVPQSRAGARAGSARFAARRAVAEARVAGALGARGVDGWFGQRVFVAAAGALWQCRASRSRPVGERRADDDSDQPAARRPACSISITTTSSSFRSRSTIKARPTVLEGHELQRRQRILHRDDHLRRSVSLRHSRRGAVRRLRRPGAADRIPQQGEEFLEPHGRKAQRAPGDSRGEEELCRFGAADRHVYAGAGDGRAAAVCAARRIARRITAESAELAHRVQSNLAAVNEEYGDKCGSGRLLPVQVREVARGTWNALRQRADERPRQLRGVQTSVPGGRRQFRRADRTPDDACAVATTVGRRRHPCLRYASIHEHHRPNHWRDGHGRSLLRAASGGGRLSRAGDGAAEFGSAAFSMACRCEFVVADLADPESFPAALADAEIVDPRRGARRRLGTGGEVSALNVVALEHLIHAAAQSGNLRRWIQVSSLGVYPAAASLRHRRNACRPNAVGLDGYTRTKAEAEILLNHHIREHGFPAVIVRPGLIYGRGDRHALPRFIEKIESGQDEVPRTRRPGAQQHVRRESGRRDLSGDRSIPTRSARRSTFTTSGWSRAKNL